MLLFSALSISCLSPSSSVYTFLERAIVVYDLFSLTRTNNSYIVYNYYHSMPQQASKTDYFIFILLLIVFLISFFGWSSFGDLHYTSMNDPTSHSEVNMAVYIIPLFLIAEMFSIVVLPGKPRLREINKKLYITLFILKIKKKLREGIDEYHQWRTKR
jgi:hypothetical protein